MNQTHWLDFVRCGLMPVLAFATAVTMPSAAEAEAQPAQPSLLDSISQFMPQVVALPAAPLPAAFQTVIAIDGVVVTLDLHQRSLRDESYTLLIDHGNGRIEAVDPGPVRTYRGSVVEKPEAVVVASLDAGKLHATVFDPDGMWHVQPMFEKAGGAAAAMHVAYKSRDVVPSGATCGVSDEGLPPTGLGNLPDADEGGDAEGGGIAGGNTGLGGNWRAQIAFDADYEYYQEWGSVGAVESQIFSIMNSVDYIYERDVNICYAVTAVIVRTSSADPYTSTDPSTRLCQMRTQWNTHHTSINRDVAHLMTGGNLDNPAVGIAYVGGINCPGVNWDVCGSIGRADYGISEDLSDDATQLLVVTHELGHNWSACHCNQSSCIDPPYSTCGIMESSIGDPPADYFNVFSGAQIENRRNEVAACELQACECGNFLVVPSFQLPTIGFALYFADCGSNIVIQPGDYHETVLWPPNGSVTLVPNGCCVTLQP